MLGGGAGSLTAAFELTATPALRDRFEVTVYQQGWRLGGKGASGRNLEEHARIEEHGLHVWFGFYDNAFRLMERCYEELEGRAPEASWADAFVPLERLVLMDDIDGEWLPWCLEVSHSAVDERSDSRLPVLEIPREGVRWLYRFWRSLPGVEGPNPFEEALAIAEGVGLMGIDSYRPVAAALRDAVAKLELDGVWGLSPRARRILTWLADAFATVLTGSYEDGLITDDGDFDEAQAVAVVDGEELRAWLTRHGARHDTVKHASFLRAFYDLAFAYPAGDRSQPGNMAAGMAVHNLLRILFMHRGCFMARLRGGMGDVMFAPLYMALRARGVRFEFFRSVSNLGLSDDRSCVASIEMLAQVAVPKAEYRPLIECDGRCCWPSKPLWDQLDMRVDPDVPRIPEPLDPDFERLPDPLHRRERKVLRRGREFHEVVLGIPLGALGAICPELSAANPRFKEMVEQVPTVMTKSLQLWLTKDAAALGSVGGSAAIIGGHAEPYDTCADMSQMIELESWPPASTPRHIAYLASVLEDADPAGRHPDDRVGGAADGFLGAPAAALWPGFEPADLLRPPLSRANHSASERYVISPSGTTSCRLAPGNSGFSNLHLAGDWTKTPFNVGCVEAAVVSGAHAAAATVKSRNTIEGRGQ